MEQFSPKTLQEAIQYFSDEEVCIQTVAHWRWPDGKPICPACGHQEHWYMAKQRRYKCKECWKQYTVKMGTILEDSPVPLTKWLPALWMLVNDKNGISSYELAKAMGITQKSAWFVLHRLRTALNKGFHMFKLGSGPNGSGAVEVDECFVGGQLRNMHKDKKVRYIKRGGAVGKAVVQGILDRDLREVRAKVVPNIKRETLQAEVLKNVKYGSRVFTDDAVAYDNLGHKFVHEVVNHAQEYVRGQVHTNGLENFWSLFKRTLRGTYVAVEPYHLQRYADEQMFRYNPSRGKEEGESHHRLATVRVGAVTDCGQAPHLRRTDPQDRRWDVFLVLIAGSAGRSRSGLIL